MLKHAFVQRSVNLEKTFQKYKVKEQKIAKKQRNTSKLSIYTFTLYLGLCRSDPSRREGCSCCGSASALGVWAAHSL